MNNFIDQIRKVHKSVSFTVINHCKVVLTAVVDVVTNLYTKPKHLAGPFRVLAWAEPPVHVHLHLPKGAD